MILKGDNQGHIMEGLKGHSKGYRFYSECKEKQQWVQELQSGTHLHRIVLVAIWTIKEPKWKQEMKLEATGGI